MAYHSSFVDDEGIIKACGCPLLPLNESHKNETDPAVTEQEDEPTDIVDEAITLFRANVFFRNFDIKSSADKLIIYLTLYINVALKRIEGCRTLAQGKRAFLNLGLEKVVIPGEPGFPFPGLFSSPKSQQEAGVKGNVCNINWDRGEYHILEKEQCRNYLKQIREETSERLLKVAYRPNGTPNKWWLAFSRRSFLNSRLIVPSEDLEMDEASPSAQENASFL